MMLFMFLIAASFSGALCEELPFLSDTCVSNNTNPFGDCECSGQIFLDDDCSEAYYCQSNSTGCSMKCPDHQMVIISRDYVTFECQNRTEELEKKCPGRIITNCGCQDDECDFGECECEFQVWVSQDCSKARKCISRFPNGVQEFQCREPNTIIHVNPDHYYVSCIEDDGRCPNKSTHFNCDTGVSTITPPTTLPPNQCNRTTNPFGDCGCQRQLFVNDHCTEGFYCLNDPEYPDTDGCSLKCADDEFLIVDPNDYLWKCVKQTDQQCPGAFHIDCPCTGEDCNFGECECPGQMWISEDCKRGKFCLGGLIPERNFSCPNLNQIIEVVDAETGEINCIQDDYRCPGAFHVPEICQSDVGECTPATNTLGTCQCDRQLHIGNDCTAGFFCLTNGTTGDGSDEGCSISCPDDQYVSIDRATDSWKCVPKRTPGSMPIICPGDFKTTCSLFGECECDGQLWFDNTCSTGKICNSDVEGGFTSFSCEDGERIDLNLTSNALTCIEDDGNCLGALKTECEDNGANSATLATFMLVLVISAIAFN